MQGSHENHDGRSQLFLRRVRQTTQLVWEFEQCDIHSRNQMHKLFPVNCEPVAMCATLAASWCERRRQETGQGRSKPSNQHLGERQKTCPVAGTTSRARNGHPQAGQRGKETQQHNGILPDSRLVPTNIVVRIIVCVRFIIKACLESAL